MDESRKGPGQENDIGASVARGYGSGLGASKPKATILVVDDNKLNRNILNKILSSEGYRVLQAGNGKEALDTLTDGKEKISLLMLDLTMPIMNGYELLGKMTQTGLISTVPVIVTTGTENGEAEFKSLEAGASDFITKPYNAELIKHRVRSMLRLFDNARLLNQLETDRLTGVLSAEFFYRRVAALLDENPDTEYEIVCSNIESFKVINAKYGKAVGDKLLKCIAEHNRDCTGKDGLCGRISADVFAVLRVARPPRSQETIGKLFAETYKDAPVKNFKMQYGVYKIADRTMPVSDMCDRAMLAIESVKRKFGIYYAVYDDVFRQKLLREHQLNDCKEQSLADGQFQVYLQPKHNTKTGELAGAEALVRWHHPELGFISPAEFIPLFEKNGFVTVLDFFVWEEVCKLLRRWQDEGRKLIPVSVNISRIDFNTSNIAEKIGKLVDSYAIPVEMLHLEITESAYTDNPREIISTVSVLRSMGFKIEMDDFGSGYSSLNMLSELPIDLIKLDMKFMKDGNDVFPSSKRSVLSFIVGLSKWLHLPTIAEGVETGDEVELLRSMGCNYIQGYFFAKPMPVTDFEGYMVKCAPAEKPNENVAEAKADGAEVNTADKPLILVVEDIADNCEILRQILLPDYRVATAENGKVAYEYILKHREEISCVTLDLLMPVMDGFQLLDQMRTDGSLEEIPVIITSEAGADSELHALELGADDFMAKPYNAEIIRHHVRRCVATCKLRRLSECGGKESAK